MMATPNDLLAIARQDLGVTEKPKNSNKVKFNTWYYGKEVSGSQYPWCMVAVQYWCNKAKVELPLKTASCTALMNAAKKSGQWVTKDFRVGDIMIFNFPNTKNNIDHCGICEQVLDNKIITIEGNTGNDSEYNGGAVLRRTRDLSLVVGAIRPKYNIRTTTVDLPVLQLNANHQAVKVLQLLLNGFGFSCGNVDGYFGKKTEQALKNYQAKNQLTVDGSCGKQTWSSLFGL